MSTSPPPELPPELPLSVLPPVLPLSELPPELPPPLFPPLSEGGVTGSLGVDGGVGVGDSGWLGAGVLLLLSLLSLLLSLLSLLLLSLLLLLLPVLFPVEGVVVPVEGFVVPVEGFVVVPVEGFDVPVEGFDVPVEGFDVPVEGFVSSAAALAAARLPLLLPLDKTVVTTAPPAPASGSSPEASPPCSPQDPEEVSADRVSASRYSE